MKIRCARDMYDSTNPKDSLLCLCMEAIIKRSREGHYSTYFHIAEYSTDLVHEVMNIFTEYGYTVLYNTLSHISICWNVEK